MTERLQLQPRPLASTANCAVMSWGWTKSPCSHWAASIRVTAGQRRRARPSGGDRTASFGPNR